MGQWLRFGLDLSVKGLVVVGIRVRVSLQEINVILFNVPKSDLRQPLCVCVCVCERERVCVCECVCVCVCVISPCLKIPARHCV